MRMKRLNEESVEPQRARSAASQNDLIERERRVQLELEKQKILEQVLSSDLSSSK